MALYLDTNILIDFVANRQPFARWVYKIFEDQGRRDWQLWTSCNSILDTYYIVEKEIGANAAKETIKILLKRVYIQGLTKKMLILALDTGFKDYEDSVQYLNALSVTDLDYIVTRYKRGFKSSSIKVLSPEELYI